MAKKIKRAQFQRLPSFQGRYMVDTVRGVLRVRRWPRRRGSPASPQQRYWIDWFRQANLLAKYASSKDQESALRYSKGTGLYPRDLILSAMRGRLYWITTTDGRKLFPMAARTSVSEALDSLGQTVGDLLIRVQEHWASLQAGAAGDVLTSQGPSLPPVWAPGGGGGITQAPLAGTPITPAGTVNQYVFPVLSNAEIVFMLDALAFASPDYPMFQLSTDGGVTYRNGATDYQRMDVTATAEVNSQQPQIAWDDGQGSGFNCLAVFKNLQAGNASWHGVSALGASARARWGYANFVGPVTHIKLYSFLGNNLSGGTIRTVGLS